MSITISLSPEEEKGLRERAARAGQDVAAYVRQLIHREIHGVSEALYEGGVLKPAQPLPLREHQRVIITVWEEAPQARISYGLIPWRGDPEVLRGIAEDPELRVLEYP